MTTRAQSDLRLVPSPTPAADAGGWRAELGEVGLVAVLLLAGLLPLAFRAAGLGTWTGGELGLAAACALFAGNQIVDRATVGRASPRAPAVPPSGGGLDARPSPARASLDVG